VQRKGGIVKGIKDLAVLIALTGMVAALLTVFFDWRARLLSRIRGESHER
jgi:hypothetical protein